ARREAAHNSDRPLGEVAVWRGRRGGRTSEGSASPANPRAPSRRDLRLERRAAGRPIEWSSAAEEALGYRGDPFVHHAAPNRSSKSRMIPPENPVSVIARATTNAAAIADAKPESQTPDQSAVIASVANAALRTTVDLEYFGETRKRRNCFPGACSSTATSNRLRPSGPPGTSRSQESNSPPALTIAPACRSSARSFRRVSSGASRSSRQYVIRRRR